MIKLSFGCYCSELKVILGGWEMARASLKRDWFIYYTFYDPLIRDKIKYKKGQLVVIKGMNQYKTLSERQAHTRLLIERELLRLEK